LLAVFALLAVGCGDGSNATSEPIIHRLAPDVVTQDSVVVLHGSGFGALVSRRSTVFVAGACAEIVSWSDDRVAFRVPRGVGIGTRLVTLVRGDGALAHLELEVGGRNLPSLGEVCAWFGTPGPIDVGVDNGPDGVVDVPDAAPDQILPDTDPPDIPPDTRPDVDPTGVYRFVRIDDISENDIGRNPGADIDAIVLTKPDGRQFFAFDVRFYQVGPNDVE